MTQPITIRADTPREAVEEVCKWLEARVRLLGGEERHATDVTTMLAAQACGVVLAKSAEALRSATIEPKEQGDG